MNDDKIINFLRELADSIENKKLDIEQTIQVSEFYMSYKFSNRNEDNSEDNVMDTDNVNKEVKDEDFLKFIILGWYIYTFIIKDIKTSENIGESLGESLGESVNCLD